MSSFDLKFRGTHKTLSRYSPALHMERHPHYTLHTFSTCIKAYKHTKNWTEYVRVDTDERLYKCSLCDKAFNQNVHLAEHIESHSENKPHDCTKCGKSFNLKANFTRHLEVHHTCEHSFVCSVCDEQFTRNSNLSRHIRTVHSESNPHQCLTCKKSFAYYNGLQKHLRQKHPYACSLCKKTFSNVSSVSYHMKSHESQVVSELNVTEANFLREISSKCDLSTTVDQGVKDDDVSTSRLALKGTKFAGLHSSEVPYTMNVKVEEDI